jgi:hypothetical protein
MISSSLRAVALATAFAITAISAATPASAAPFDGSWSVTIMTRSGSCDPAYRYGISISNGVVSGGGGAASVSGRVSNSGAVSVMVSSNVGSARGTGRLSRNSGGGSWSGQGSQGRCSGSWSASRG